MFVCKNREGLKTLIKSQKYFFAQKFIFLFGAPGVGKGCFAKFLRNDLKMNHISTGDEIRKILKGQASSTFDIELRKQIKEIVEAGKLVNDNIVIDIIKEKIKEPESANGVIFDGFPRTQSQLEKYDAQGFPIDLVVNLTLNKSIMMDILLGRRVCNGCGTNYNYCPIHRDGYEMEPILPRQNGICDKCGSTDIVSRADDCKEVILARMIEYEQKTLPILKLFQNRGKVFNFEAKKGVRDYPRFLAELTSLLNQN